MHSDAERGVPPAEHGEHEARFAAKKGTLVSGQFSKDELDHLNQAPQA